MRRSTTQEEEKLFRALLVQNIRRHNEIPLDASKQEVCDAFDQLPLSCQIQTFHDICPFFPCRSYRWCYLHYKKTYQKAVYPHVLNPEERQQLVLDVRRQAVAGREIRQIYSAVSKQSPLSLVFADALYAIVHKAFN